MVDPFGDVSFLTRSENRVTVLETLAEAPHTERELVEATGISDVTVGRILEDFRERNWIRETDEGFEPTQLGEMLASDYTRLSDSMEVAARLGPVFGLLPVAEMDFDFHHLTEARVSDPDRHDTLRAVDRWIELIETADRIVGTKAGSSPTTVISTIHEEVTADRLHYEVVYAAETVENIRANQRAAEMHTEMVAAGATLYRAPEGVSVPNSIALCDDLATIVGFDDAGSLRVGIETRADPVREWVRDTFESYRAEATPLDPEDFIE